MWLFLQMLLELNIYFIHAPQRVLCLLPGERVSDTQFLVMRYSTSLQPPSLKDPPVILGLRVSVSRTGDHFVLTYTPFKKKKETQEGGNVR